MPDVISDTNGKLCVGSYHMWRLLSNPDNYSFPSGAASENPRKRCSQAGRQTMTCISIFETEKQAVGMFYLREANIQSWPFPPTKNLFDISI